ncbi:hypothetical protein lerEdw1_013890 [Lerista edwardsae]|nr:hypothetical protein lerEdw1_013890 [Lerista edwardsae]
MCALWPLLPIHIHASSSLITDMFAQLDPGYFTTAMWTLSLGALGAAVTGMILANTDLFLVKPEEATLEFLEKIELKTLGQASELSSLKPELDKLGVPLYAVVKEDIGTEVVDFQPYFKGEIFLDEKKRFYGPRKRTMLFLGFFRLSVWLNFFRARSSGYTGNMNGEGIILGGTFVLGAGKQGILLESREKEFGNKVNLTAVLDAVKKIQP